MVTIKVYESEFGEYLEYIDLNALREYYNATSDILIGEQLDTSSPIKLSPLDTPLNVTTDSYLRREVYLRVICTQLLKMGQTVVFFNERLASHETFGHQKHAIFLQDNAEPLLHLIDARIDLWTQKKLDNNVRTLFIVIEDTDNLLKETSISLIKILLRFGHQLKLQLIMTGCKLPLCKAYHLVDSGESTPKFTCYTPTTKLQGKLFYIEVAQVKDILGAYATSKTHYYFESNANLLDIYNFK